MMSFIVDSPELQVIFCTQTQNDGRLWLQEYDPLEFSEFQVIFCTV